MTSKRYSPKGDEIDRQLAAEKKRSKELGKRRRAARRSHRVDKTHTVSYEQQQDEMNDPGIYDDDWFDVWWYNLFYYKDEALKARATRKSLLGIDTSGNCLYWEDSADYFDFSDTEW